MNAPPSGLVALSTLPLATWVGRHVYHPLCQIGATPCWRAGDVPEEWRGPEDEDPASEEWQYDGGVVESVKDNSFLGCFDVTFAVVGGGHLRYAADNLWTLP